MCDSEHGAVGCGPQEEFRACSDIQIGEGVFVPPAPKANTTTDVISKPTEPAESTDESIFPTIIIISLILILILCTLAAIYRYHYQGHKIPQILKWKQNIFSSQKPATFQEKTAPVDQPPVPPPRAKRRPLV